MENMFVSRILIVCVAAIAVTSAEISVSVAIDKPQVRLGENVQVRCHIINKEKKVFFVIWAKKVGEVEVEIGTNLKINDPFLGTGRYTPGVEFKREKDLSDVTFYINITGAAASDSGEIGCKLPKLHMLVFQDFIVQVPFSTMMMQSRYLDGTHEVTYQTDETMQFDEGEKRVFTCRAAGAYPKPKMTITLGDKDITSEFNKTAELKKEGTPGLYLLSYDIELKHQALEITYQFARNKLECKATVPDTDFVSATSINIELSGYKPQFMCKDVLEVPLHKEDVNITCIVYADPPIIGNMTEYLWERESAGNDTIVPGDSLGQFTAHLEPGKDEFEKILTLHIEHIYIQHFRTYYFEVTNSLGTVKHGVEVRRAPNYVLDTEAPTSGKTVKQVPGKKDNPNSAMTLTLRHVLPGVTMTTLLMVLLL